MKINVPLYYQTLTSNSSLKTKYLLIIDDFSELKYRDQNRGLPLNLNNLEYNIKNSNVKIQKGPRDFIYDKFFELPVHFNQNANAIKKRIGYYCLNKKYDPKIEKDFVEYINMKINNLKNELSNKRNLISNFEKFTKIINKLDKANCIDYSIVMSDLYYIKYTLSILVNENIDENDLKLDMINTLNSMYQNLNYSSKFINFIMSIPIIDILIFSTLLFLILIAFNHFMLIYYDYHRYNRKGPEKPNYEVSNQETLEPTKGLTDLKNLDTNNTEKLGVDTKLRFNSDDFDKPNILTKEKIDSIDAYGLFQSEIPEVYNSLKRIEGSDINFNNKNVPFELNVDNNYMDNYGNLVQASVPTFTPTNPIQENSKLLSTIPINLSGSGTENSNAQFPYFSPAGSVSTNAFNSTSPVTPLNSSSTNDANLKLNAVVWDNFKSKFPGIIGSCSDCHSPVDSGSSTPVTLNAYNPVTTQTPISNLSGNYVPEPNMTSFAVNGSKIDPYKIPQPQIAIIKPVETHVPDFDPLRKLIDKYNYGKFDTTKGSYGNYNSEEYREYLNQADELDVGLNRAYWKWNDYLNFESREKPYGYDTIAYFKNFSNNISDLSFSEIYKSSLIGIFNFITMRWLTSFIVSTTSLEYGWILGVLFPVLIPIAYNIMISIKDMLLSGSTQENINNKFFEYIATLSNDPNIRIKLTEFFSVNFMRYIAMLWKGEGNGNSKVIQEKIENNAKDLPKEVLLTSLAVINSS